MSIEAMKQALEALGPNAPECCGCRAEWEIAITALRQAIAEEALNRKAENARELGLTYEFDPEPEKQEPVAWANPSDLQNFDMKVRAHGGPLHSVPLYTTPQQRTWVGLTDEEIMEMLDYGQYGRVPQYARNFVDAIEAKLKEKNT